MQNERFSSCYFEEISKKVAEYYSIDISQIEYFVFRGEVKNQAYNAEKERINILKKNGNITDIVEASDDLTMSGLSNSITKYFICYPKLF
jgi:hypothetical protein